MTKNHVTTFAICWKLKLKNNLELGFTDFARDLEIENLIYKARSGFRSSSIDNHSAISQDNFEVGGFLDSEDIKKKDILEGLYDNAYLEVFVIDYQNINNDKVILKTGYLGDIKMLDNQFVSEVRGVSYKLSNMIGQLYSPTCRAEFCDSKCKLKRPKFIECNIISIEDGIKLKLDQEINNPLYNYGFIEIIGRNNHIVSIGIRSCDKEIIYLTTALRNQNFPMKCKIYLGCDKTFATCCDVFNNAINFRGEPHMPGIDAIHKTAGTFR